MAVQEDLREERAQPEARGRARSMVQCYLRPEQAEGLRRLAAEQDTPVSILVRQAISRLLREAKLG